MKRIQILLLSILFSLTTQKYKHRAFFNKHHYPSSIHNRTLIAKTLDQAKHQAKAGEKTNSQDQAKPQAEAEKQTQAGEKIKARGQAKPQAETDEQIKPQALTHAEPKNSQKPAEGPRPPDEVVLTNHEFIPPYIDEMIKKYKTDDNNIFFVITPINKNVFHGDIHNSKINSMAGGQGNSASNVENTLIVKTTALQGNINQLSQQMNELKEQNAKLLKRKSYAKATARHSARMNYTTRRRPAS